MLKKMNFNETVFDKEERNKCIENANQMAGYVELKNEKVNDKNNISIIKWIKNKFILNKNSVVEMKLQTCTGHNLASEGDLLSKRLVNKKVLKTIESYIDYYSKNGDKSQKFIKEEKNLKHANGKELSKEEKMLINEKKIHSIVMKMMLDHGKWLSIRKGYNGYKEEQIVSFFVASVNTEINEHQEKNGKQKMGLFTRLNAIKNQSFDFLRKKLNVLKNTVQLPIGYKYEMTDSNNVGDLFKGNIEGKRID